MTRCGCGELTEPSGCLCEVVGTNDFDWDGDGTESTPYILEPNLDVDADNLLTCDSSGLMAELPAVLANPPAVRAFRTINLTVANNTLTAVNLDQESYDTDSMHSTAANTNRVTFNTAGTYVVTFTCTWEKNATGYRYAQIRKNGTDVLAYESKKAPSEADLYLAHPITIIESFSAADYIEGMVFQTSGAALILLSGAGSPILAAARIAP